MTRQNPIEQERLSELLRKELGAELRSSKLTLTNEDGLERIFVVVWKRAMPHGVQWGTHRAIIHDGLHQAVLIWGHYFDGAKAIVEAYSDFLSRIAEGV